MNSPIKATMRVLNISLLLALGSTAFAGTIPAGTDTASHGNLLAGGKFGMAIGQPASAVEQILWAQGYGYQGMAECTSTISQLFGCRAGERYLEFQPLQLDRKGHVYLKIEGDRVAQIGWELTAVAYSDG
jgi:hypothetical protein